jgi:hypothetical protein
MIKKLTVLVLGTGASKPYGFPVGAEPVDQICREILDDNHPDRDAFIERLEIGKAGNAMRFAKALKRLPIHRTLRSTF